MRNLFRKTLLRKNPFKKAAAALALTACLAGTAVANPTGPDVRHGTVNITGLGGASVNIQQLTNQAIVNWDSFSIGAAEAVRFLQPSQMAVILNRVTGQDPSQILGSLSANGQVFLINPNGILFGPNSTVDVGGLVASTLGLSDAEFLAGNYTFTQDPRQELASVINQGTITISDGGYAVLTAPLVANEGLIVANLGKVALAAGERTTLNFDGRDLINFEVGALPGDAGTVVLPKEAVGGILADMLGAEDRAGELVQLEDGTLALESGSGLAYQAGTIRADGASGEQAGTVIIDSARLTVLGENSVTAADGVDSDGGTVLALSDFDNGTIVGNPGSVLSATGDNGGFIEFSAEHFLFGSTVDAAGIDGAAGTFFLDPTNIRIVDGAIGGSTFTAALDTITDGDINNMLLTMNVSLLADNNINFDNSGVSGNAVTINGTNSLALTATTQAVDFQDASITVGELEVNAGGDIRLRTSDINAPGGTVVLVSGGSVISLEGAGEARIEAASLGIQAPNSVNSDNGTRILNVDVDNLALNSDGFTVAVNDTSGGLTVVPTVSSTNLTVNTGGNPFEGGLQASGGGDLTLEAAPQFNVGFYKADGNLDLAGNLTGGFDFLIIADDDNDGNGAITQSAGTYTGTGLGLSAGDGGIGTAGALANGIRVNAEFLTIETTGSANVVDTTDGVELVDQIDIGFEVLADETLVGITTGGSLQVNAQGGDTANLTVSGDIDSVGTNADLVADNDVSITGTAVITGNLVIRADADNSNAGNVDISGASIAAANLGLAGNGDFGDPAGAPLVLDFNNVAVNGDPNNDGTGGQVYIQGTTDLTIAPVTGVVQSITTTRAAGDMKLEAAGGNLTVSAPTSASGNVDLVATVDVSAGASVTASGGNLMVFADSDSDSTGAITQSGGTLTATNVGLSAANDIGSVANPITIEATNAAIETNEGSVFVNDPSALNIINQVVGICNTVTGNTAATDYRVESAGLLTISDTITAPDIALVSSGGGIQVNSEVIAVSDAVLDANGDIAGNATVSAGNVGLSGGNVGTSANPISTTATNLAVTATTGSAYIAETDGLTIVDQVTSTTALDSVTGNSAAADYRLDVGGRLVVNDDIDATDISLIVDNAFNGIETLNANITATQDLVIRSTGVVNQNGGFYQAANIGIESRFSTGGDAPAEELLLDATNLVANASIVLIQDTTGGVNLVNSVSATASNDTVTGNNTGDSRINSTDGDLNINAAVNNDAGDLQLLSNTSINFNANVEAATGVFIADSDNNGSGAITQTQGFSIIAPDLGLSAGDGGIGTAGSDIDALDITTENLAIETSGNANVLDSADGLTIINEVEIFNETFPGVVVTGTVIGGSLELEAAGGDTAFLTINDEVQVGTGADLVADDDVNINSEVTVTNNLVIRADDDLNNNGNITAAANIAATGLGLHAFGDIGDPAGAPIDVNVETLAVDTDGDNNGAGGNVYIRDNSGDLTIASVTGVDETVGVARSAGDLKLEAAAGSLNLNADANAGNEADLTALNDVNLNANVTAANNATVVATNGSITQQQTNRINAANLGLSAGGNVGAIDNFVDLNVNALAITSGGSAYAANLGLLEIVDSVTALGTTVTGNNATNDYLVQSGGTLTVNDEVTADDIALISSAGGVTLNNEVTADNDLTVQARGDITGGATLRAVNIGLRGNNVGTTGTPIRTSADRLALNATTSGFVTDIDAVNIENSVTAAGQTVTGNTAGADYRVEAGANIEVNDQIQADDVALIAADVGDINLTQNVSAANDAVLIAGGSVTGAGVVSGANVGISAINIGTVGTPVNVSADNLAVNANTNSYISEANSVTIVDNVTATASGDSVTGNRAGIDFQLTAGGSITVDDEINAVDVALVNTAGNIVVNQNVVGESAVVLDANADISGGGTLISTSVGLSGVEIGANGANINTRAQNLAVNATNNSFVSNDGDLTIVDTVSATTGMNQVTGNSAGGDYRVTAAGNIDVNDDIGATDVSLVGTGGTSDITLAANINAAQDLVLIADSEIQQDSGTLSGANIGLQATESIRGFAIREDLVVDATNLVANSNVVLVRDTTGGLNLVNSVSSTTGADAVTGIAGDRLRFVSTDGSLNIGTQVTADERLQLLSNLNVNLNANVSGPTTVIVADSDGGGSGAITQMPGNTITANTALGLSAGDGGIGIAGGRALNVNTGFMALETSGNANVLDTAGGLSVVNNVSTGGEQLPQVGVTGTVIGGSLELEASGGDTAFLAIQDQLQVGTNADLVADDNVVILTDVTVTDNLVIRADDDQNDDGGIVIGNPQVLFPPVVTATGLGLHSAENIGDPAGAPLQVNVETLAVDTDSNMNNIGGSVYVRDNSGDLTIASVTGVNQTVGVARSASDLKLEAAAGTLNLNTDAIAGNDADITALNDINLNANVIATNNAALVANNGTIGQQQGNRINAANLGLSAAGNIGAVNNFVDLNVNTLALTSVGGSVYISDLGTLELVDTVTSLQSAVTGNTAVNDFVVESGGTLTVSDEVMANAIALRANAGDVNLNSNITADSDATVQAEGNISGSATVAAANVGLGSSNVGSSGAPININATNLAMSANTSGYVTDPDGINIENSVTAGGQTVTGNMAGTDYRVEAGGTINVNDQIQAGDVALVTTAGDVNVAQNVTGTNDVVISAAANVTGGGIVGGTNVGLAGNSIGAVGAPSRVNATNLALNSATNSYVAETNNVNLINSVTSTANGDSVTGNMATGDFQLTAGGAINVNDQVEGTDVALVTTAGDIALTQGVVATNNAVLSASANITGNGTVTATSVGLAGAEIGTAANNVNTATQNLAVAAGTNSYVSNTGDLNIIDQVTSTAVNSQVTGNTSGGDYRVTTTGNLNVNDDVTAQDTSLLATAGNIDLQNGTVDGQQNAVLQASGDIVNNGGQVTGGSVGLQAGGSAGTSTSGINIDANNLTVNAGGEVFVTDPNDVTLVNSVSSTAAADTVTSNQANGNFRVIAQTGNLQVDADVTSANNSVELEAGTNLVLNGEVRADNGNVAGIAGQDISVPGDSEADTLNQGNLNIGFIAANQIGLQAGGDIGSLANPIQLNATDLTYNSGNDTFVEDTAGGVNLINSVTGVSTTINGPTAGRDSRIVADNGTLTVSATVAVGRNGELVTRGSGDIVVNQDYDAPNGNTVFRSAGDITGTGTVTTSGLGLDAPNGDIGSAAQPLAIDVDTLTVGSRPFTTAPQSNFQRITDVTAIIETVTDPDIRGPVLELLPDSVFIDGSTFAQNNINIVEEVLKEALDNYDLIYNDAGWQDINDDDFGTNRR